MPSPRDYFVFKMGAPPLTIACTYLRLPTATEVPERRAAEGEGNMASVTQSLYTDKESPHNSSVKCYHNHRLRRRRDDIPCYFSLKRRHRTTNEVE